MLSTLEQIVFFFLGFIAAIVTLYYNSSQRRKKWSKAHFYVARDKHKGSLYLWLGKPIRGYETWHPSNGISTRLFGVPYFELNGLNLKDFRNLKWEDDPVEVFLKLDF